MSRAIGKRGKQANKRAKQAPKLHSDDDLAYISSLKSAINPQVFNAQSESTSQSKHPKSDEFQTNKPFSHLMIDEFFDSRFMTCLKKELRDSITYDQKHNDLYNFYQSEDLKSIDSPAVKKARESLYSSEFRSLLESITGIAVNELSSDVSMSAAVYSDTSRLLCHDDELQGRRIAYILYLVDEPWTEADGGHLDLFDSIPANEAFNQSINQSMTDPSMFSGSTSDAWQSKESFVPHTVARSYLPKYNTFAFFAVSPVSFHQVREVTTDRQDVNVPFDPERPRVRLSISGWFHGDEMPRPVEISEPAATFQLLPAPSINQSASSEQSILQYWINPDYLKPKTLKQIASHFESESSVDLNDWLRAERLNECQAELANASQEKWKETGPAIRRKYYTLMTEQLRNQSLTQSATHSNSQSVKSVVHELYEFLHSSAFSNYLKSLTGFSLASSSREIRRFTSSCYTLIRDDDPERKQEALDCHFTLLTNKWGQTLQSQKQPINQPIKTTGKKSKTKSTPVNSLEWDPTWGGITHYIAAGAEESLLSLEPVHNTLSLVYRAGEQEKSENDSDNDNEDGENENEDDDEDETGEGGVMRFVDYVNHHAKLDRCDFAAVYRVQEQEEEQQ